MFDLDLNVKLKNGPCHNFNTFQAQDLKLATLIDDIEERYITQNLLTLTLMYILKVKKGPTHNFIILKGQDLIL